MTTYLSSLLTSTTSRYNNLRRSLLSDESDGDTEEDSHISRVLRAYYIEKGRPFPTWLGPDPSASQSTSSLYSQSSARQQPQPASTRRGGGLSDLWDSPAQSSQPQQPASLRRAGGPGFTGRNPPSGPPVASSTSAAGLERLRSAEPQSSKPQRPLPHGARSMPAQQQQQAFQPVAGRDPARSSGPATTSLSAAGASGSSAQDRLKAKLWGAGRTTTSRDPG